MSIGQRVTITVEIVSAEPAPDLPNTTLLHLPRGATMYFPMIEYTWKYGDMLTISYWDVSLYLRARINDKPEMRFAFRDIVDMPSGMFQVRNIR